MALKVVVFVALSVLALYGLHRLATWAEACGWIYYRGKRRGGGSLSSAVVGVQSLLQPAAAHVVEERRRTDLVRQEAGDSDSGELCPVEPSDPNTFDARTESLD
jgi:hypothetical protein